MRLLLQRHAHVWDKLGIGTSVLCLIHCLALPALLLVGGTALAVLDNVHMWVVILLVPTVFIAGYGGYRIHGNWAVILLLAAGLAAVVGALAVKPWLGGTGETAITMLGGLALLLGHMRNLSLGTNLAHVHEQ